MAQPGDFASTVKLQADIVRVVGEYVKLKKSGAQNFSGLCPFHNEKTPSFSVHATRQFYHCFGCGASGDVFSFVQKVENITFPEAVRALATKLNIPLPQREYSPAEARDASLRAKLIELHEEAAKFFQEQMRTPAAAAAREYLTGRGLTDAVFEQFRIGYAPDSGFALRDRVKAKYDEATLKQSGLFSFKDEQGGVGALYSKFRNRIIFPIANEQGKVIAFGGRRMETGGTAAERDKAGPKYLNSPETPIYSKGRVLYNLDKAKEAIRSLDYSIVVEGYMDCIAVFTAGMKNVIASSGTAFGEAQVKLLGRYSRNIAVNFDPDAAGAAATERSLATLVEEDFNIKVLALEPGLDPDLFIRRRGVEAYGNALRSAPKYFHYLIERAQQQFPARTPESKVKALNYLLPHIQRVPSRIARDELAAEAAQRLGIDSAVLRQELKSAAGSRSQRIGEGKNAAQGGPQVTPAEKVLLKALLSSDVALRGVARAAIEQDRLHEGWTLEPVFAALSAAARENPEALTDPLALPLEENDRNRLAAVLMNDDDGVVPDIALLTTSLAALRHLGLERRLRQVQEQIDQAARKNDSVLAAQLASEKMALKRALDESRRQRPVAGSQ